MFRSLIIAAALALSVSISAEAGTSLSNEEAALSEIIRECGPEAALFNTEAFSPIDVFQQLQAGLVDCQILRDGENRLLLFGGFWVVAPNVTQPGASESEIPPNFDGYYIAPHHNGCTPAMEYVDEDGSGYTTQGWIIVQDRLMCTTIARCTEIAAEYGFPDDFRPVTNRAFTVLERKLAHDSGPPIVQTLLDQPGSFQYGACYQE